MIKRLKIAVLLAIAGVILLASPVMAWADPPDSDPVVIRKHIYRNLIEDGDRLFVIYANIPYAAPPPEPITEVFIWQLIDTDGSTVLGSTVGYAYVNLGYGYQVFSMYFDAAAGLGWDPSPAYTLRLRGNPLAFVTPPYDDPPVYNYPVESVDYSPFTLGSDNRSQLALDVLSIADDLDLQWGLAYSLIAEDETGQYLSTFGQTYFRGTIYGIQALAPRLFALAHQPIDLEDRVWGSAYEEELAEQYVGTWIEQAQAAGMDLFGTDWDLLSVIVVAAAVIGIIIANIYLTSDAWNGLIDGALLLVIFAKLGMFQLGLLALLAALCVMYISTRVVSFIRG